MKTRQNRTEWALVALAMILALGASEVHAQEGLGRAGGKGDVSVKPRVSKDACRTLDRYVASFKTKLDDILHEIVVDSIVSGADPASNELLAGDNPFLDQFVQSLVADASFVAQDITIGIDTVLHPYLDRAGMRLCALANEALTDTPDPGLGSATRRGRVRNALCNALDQHFVRVENRIEDAALLKSTSMLSGLAPTVPPQTAALMGPGEKQRVEAEIAWFVMALSSRISDRVSAEVTDFHDRIRARKCNR